MRGTSIAPLRMKKGMGLVPRLFYGWRRGMKWIGIFLAVSGPGIIVMVADNDAGGITTYAATGARYGYGLLWFLVILGPVAYFVQEMTVRLGAVTKRGHAEAIFDAFGPFWGWFSLLDLILTDWLTLITEFIGMTAALSIFHVPPFVTVIVVSVVMFLMVLQGRYWTWEKIAMLFCVLNLVYIPCAIIVHPSVSEIVRPGLIPNFPGGFNNQLFFFLMANIGTTIAPWMIFFQQSAVVDKGIKEKDVPWSKLDTAHRVGVHGARRGVRHHHHGDGAEGSRRGQRRPGRHRPRGHRTAGWERSWPSGCSTPGSSAPSASPLPARGRSARCSAGRTR